MLHAHFPHRAYELHHVAEDGALIEAFGTDYVEGFEAKMNTVLISIKSGEQMIVFHEGNPQFCVDRDFTWGDLRSDL